MTSGPQPPEVPDLNAEVERVSSERIARMRHRARIRAAHSRARKAGIAKRNANKLQRIRRERGEQ